MSAHNESEKKFSFLKLLSTIKSFFMGIISKIAGFFSRDKANSSTTSSTSMEEDTAPPQSAPSYKPPVPTLPAGDPKAQDLEALNKELEEVEKRLAKLKIEFEDSYHPERGTRPHDVVAPEKGQVEAQYYELKAKRYAFGSGLDRKEFLKQKGDELIAELEAGLEAVRKTLPDNKIPYQDHDLSRCQQIFRNCPIDYIKKETNAQNRIDQNLIENYEVLTEAVDMLRKYQQQKGETRSAKRPD